MANNDTGQLFGPYIIHERLGMGGMATVHRATEIVEAGCEREVALKRLLPHLVEDESFVRSFVREAKVASLLQHPNIIKIYELGRVHGSYFISMEHIAGRDVRKILRQCKRVVGPPPIPITIALLIQLCDALDYAHTRTDADGRPLGFVHRDVSPSNLLVAPDGQLKVIDFGIAKAQTEGLRTNSGRVKGKVAYMAPEVAQGLALDARSDLFSVGVIAHELITATPLFASKSDYETLMRVQRLAVSPPSQTNISCPKELDHIVLSALQKAAVNRSRSAGELRDALQSLQRQYGYNVGNKEVADWCEWAFSLSDAGKAALMAENSPVTQDDYEAIVSMDSDVLLMTDCNVAKSTEAEMGVISAADFGETGISLVAHCGDTERLSASTVASLADLGRAEDFSHKQGVWESPSVEGRAVILGEVPDVSDRVITPKSILSPVSGAVSVTGGAPRYVANSMLAFSTDAHRVTPPLRTHSVTFPIGGVVLPRHRSLWIGLSAMLSFLIVLGVWKLQSGSSVASATSAKPVAASSVSPIISESIPKVTSMVSFGVVPQGATVQIGDKRLRADNFDNEIVPGVYPVTVHKAGYKPWSSQLTIRPGERQKVVVALQKEQVALSVVELVSKPADLRIAIDGKNTGQITPAVVSLPPGEHLVSLSHRTVGTVWSKKIVTAPAEEVHLAPNLRRVIYKRKLALQADQE